MADPAAHQIEERAARRQHGAIEIRQRGDRAVIDVLDETGRLVEQRVVRFVEAGEGARRQAQRVLWFTRHVAVSFGCGEAITDPEDFYLRQSDAGINESYIR